MESTVVIIGVIAATCVAIFGVLAIVYLLFSENCLPPQPVSRDKNLKASILAVIGSGGHTSELLRLMGHLGSHYEPRYYVMANTDVMSEKKVHKLEKDANIMYRIYKIPRSREVKQSWITTVLSTIVASVYALPLVFKLRPDIILCNGPGTCIPVCLGGLILKLFYPLKLVYVESICRVDSMSLSGKILYHCADSVIVQWPQLQKKYPKSLYMGRVV
ncbi:UDP-N-acetylglucosamine transferase subunit ALG14 homolog [Dreissena polymorpha]|uniref:UDP-N-acetylglucosamine transferase subunit ALG14 n=1 Tax=Dreissena polymorpha TaxID=45954 RepID=A0A9D3Y915_DREPO|nr:UDP-N-acetylglucosamine transferase subunit ALG14 homolog [Dreissena polymorpha]KAH3694009.1 hypothetical protein DPMN_081448 [Dreissena polymorpha]